MTASTKRFDKRHFAAGAALLLIGLCSLIFASTGGAVVAGAGFTTYDTTVEGCFNGNGVNCNIYDSKEAVYMSGGPEKGGSDLSDGEYFFAVVTPGEENGGFIDGAKGNLSDTTAGGTEGDAGSGDEVSNRTFTVTGHAIAAYGGTHPMGTSPQGKEIIGLAPFDDTDNPGGEYILAICKVGATSPKECKYDAFKIKGEGEEEVTPFGTISGLKYYDVNHNGQFDSGEAPLPGWAIDWTDTVSGKEITDMSGLFEVKNLVTDTYTFTEEQGPAGWVQTGNTVNEGTASAGSEVILNADKTYTVVLASGGTASGLNFGNVCEINNTNGLTLGFWSNKNGQAILKAAANEAKWRSLVNTSNLRDAKGNLFTLASGETFAKAYEKFRTWLLNATATNMSYMLSAQLIATELDIAFNGLNGGNLVKAPNGKWLTINEVVAGAITFLSTHPNTTAYNADRELAEAYKNIFDSLNNNIQKITPVDPSKCPAYSFSIE